MRCAYAYASGRTSLQQLPLAMHDLLSIAQDVWEIPSPFLHRITVVLISHLHFAMRARFMLKEAIHSGCLHPPLPELSPQDAAEACLPTHY